ncbi:MAG TPA: hypothetical protein VGH51_22035 [Candidatus Angelobacter sp.]|jgi:hypothetical protein
MQLRIKNASEFHKLLFALAGELVDAHIHFTLFRDLSASRSEYCVEFAQANTFWSLTLEAHLDATLVRLCKSFDLHRQSLNLRTLVSTVKDNLHLFGEQDFRDRLKGNAFVDSLAATYRIPSTAMIQADLDFVSPNNPLVRKLTVWRDKHIAHRDPSPVLNPEELTGRYPLLFTDIDELLRGGLRIVNEYSSLFIATTHSSGMVGKDDYLTILKAVRDSLNRYEAMIEQEWQMLAKASENTA